MKDLNDRQLSNIITETVMHKFYGNAMKDLNYHQLSNIVTETEIHKFSVDKQIQELIDQKTASCEVTLHMIGRSSALSRSEKDKLLERVNRLGLPTKI